MRAALLQVALLTVFAYQAHATDIHLTLDNGAELLLHDDLTWTCSGARNELNNMTVALEDGKEIHLGADGKWRYLIDEDSDEAEGLATLYHTGSSRGTDVRETVEHAKGLALDGISRRLLRQVMAKGTLLAEVRTCVEEMDKLVEHEERMVKGVYEVKVTVRLDRAGIAAVKECVELSQRLKERMDSSGAGE